MVKLARHLKRRHLKIFLKRTFKKKKDSFDELGIL